MLRYVERAGLVARPLTRRLSAVRTGELQRLRTLRELLERIEVGLADVGFALRLRRDAELQARPSKSGSGRPCSAPTTSPPRMARLGAKKHERLLVAAAPYPSATGVHDHDTAT